MYGDYPDIIAAALELQSLAGLNHQFYVGADAVITPGWYRVKMPEYDKYLTYNEGFKFSGETEAEDDYRVMFLNNYASNLEVRFLMYPYPELQGNRTSSAFKGPNAFFGVAEAGLIDGQTSYILRCGGTGNPTISSFNEADGTFTYGNVNETRDLRYRMLIEPVTLGEPETSLEDGEYYLSFNGTYIGAVSVVEDSVRIEDIPYAITRYGSSEPYTYAIGQNDENGYFISEAMDVEVPNGTIVAMPRPGFQISNEPISGITVTDANDPVVAERYFNLQGVEIRQPSQTGIYIVKKIHQSQKEEAVKIRIVDKY
jgi:hypothetical protein